MKRLSIGTLSHWHIGTLFIGALFFSCTQELVQPTGTNGETVSVRLNITTTPMQTVGTPLTRATTDKTDDEPAVHRTWVLQFSGNTAAGRLLKAEEVTFTGNALETELLHTDATCRVYIVANSDCTPFAADAAAGNGISLADFEASLSAFAATRTIDAGTGLPMCACQDFNPRTDAPAAAFALKPLVAKLTFKLNIDPGFTGFTVNSITLKQVAEGTTFKESAAGNEAVRPAGTAYTGELDLAGADATALTCYLPENLSGRNTALKSMWQRGKVNAPENATYVEVEGTTTDGTSYTYSFFLGDGTPQDFNLMRNVHYNLTATLNGTSEADLRVKQTFINLNTDGQTANCYLVYESDEEYSFNATVMGNGATTEAATQGGTASGARIVPQTLSPKSVKVLWETGSMAGAIVSSVKLSKDKTKVIFKTGAAAGNAVIAVYDNIDPNDANAKILWSWHIWRPETEVTDFQYQKYVDNTGVVKTADNYRMMDRNLGATVSTPGNADIFGLLYQWGRKDPFPGSKNIHSDIFIVTTPSLGTKTLINKYVRLGIDVPVANNADCIAYSIQHPTTFFEDNNNSPSDWIKDSQDNLWGNPWENDAIIYTIWDNEATVNSGVGSKSIYDPCPVGYRVPPQDTWTCMLKEDGTDYKDSSNEWHENIACWLSTTISVSASSIFFPAVGKIGSFSIMGTLSNAGNYGDCWSSSPKNDYSGYSGCCQIGNSYSAGPTIFASREQANSVRCVSELVSE